MVAKNAFVGQALNVKGLHVIERRSKQLNMLDGPLMLRVNLAVVETIHP